MKHYLLLSCALGATSFCIAQNTQEISKWAALHPDIYLVSSENYNSVSQEMKDKIGDNILVYEGKLTLEDIERFDQSKSMNKETPIREDEAQEIKDWLGQHPDLKIIPRSFFDSLNATEQQVYVQHGTMILIGETVTLEDIRNY
jgi:hypothetical protein